MIMSGSSKEDMEADAAAQLKRSFRGILRKWIACVGAFSISMVGGVMLTCWEMKYHQSNSQLWMVPFGLILLATPVVVWLSIFVSDILGSKKEEDGYDGISIIVLRGAANAAASSSMPPATAASLQQLSIHGGDPES